MNVLFKGEIVFVRVLIAVLTGVILGINCPFQEQAFPMLAAMLAGLLLLFGFLLAAYKKYRLYLRKWLPSLVANVLIIACFYIITSQNHRYNLSEIAKDGKIEGLVGTVISEPKKANDILRFQLKVEQALAEDKFMPASGTILVALKLDSLELSRLSYGDQLLLPHKLVPVDPPFNPQEFNYKKYLANQGIYFQMFCSSEELQLLASHQANRVVELAQSLRREAVSFFEVHLKDREATALASTLILGYRADLSPEIVNAYSKTGTMHVLSVSGMHVALVLWILAKLLWFLNGSRKSRMVQAVVIVLLISFYALITGFSPSVCRAALMISILTIGKALNRRSNPYNLLAASAVLLLVYNPYFLLDVGFQLSYLAVAGLVFFYPPIYHFIYIKNWVMDKIWACIAVSVAAQLSTFPLGLFYFHQFPVYFLLSNLLIVLPVSIIMFSGLAFLCVKALGIATGVSLPLLLDLLSLFLRETIHLTNNILYAIEKLPFASLIYYNQFHSFFALLFLLILTASLFMIKYEKKWLYASFVSLFLLVALHSSDRMLKRRQHQIVFYSLRKNSAFAVFDGNKAYCYSDLSFENKTFTFSVKPSIDAQGGELMRMVEEKTPFLFQGNVLQYRHFRLLIWDKQAAAFSYSSRLKVNAVLLTGNPYLKLSTLLRSVKTDLLLIDATNKDYRIRQWVEEARELGLKSYVLKRRPSYLVDLAVR
ncbi:ComEC/Rec2 family competence protein [Pedobacter sp. SYSU D00535]|uniref:ComEC/Rec2 family competence protein n=1 Tax=Pedobacter sp. SYSU D00535 TaxID=2810308 RepID=UPI001A975E5C|nr:ComEC/Rec2 family competence protein [Pedobacter sp. SYSU D00535]